MFLASYSIGPNSIPWFIVSELFSQASRSAAMCVTMFVNWLINIPLTFAIPYYSVVSILTST